MDEAQVLGKRITHLESWFAEHPGVYDLLKRDELRTLYATFGDDEKALEQSDIILANQLNDEKTILLLGEPSTISSGDTTVELLLNLATRFPQFKYVQAAARIRAADLMVENRQTKLAAATYRLAFSSPGRYAIVARGKYEALGATASKGLGVKKSRVN